MSNDCEKLLLKNERWTTIEENIAKSSLLLQEEIFKTIEILWESWETLNRTFARAIKTYDGSVDSFIKTYSPDVHLVGRVFFHLVEQKYKDTPFAFLATFSTGLDKQGQSRHWPLKWALTEYAGDNEKLLDLLSTVHKAGEQSELVRHLLDSGELFHPLS
jgi:non-specific serine/threonine protein kinase